MWLGQWFDPFLAWWASECLVLRYDRFIIDHFVLFYCDSENISMLVNISNSENLVSLHSVFDCNRPVTFILNKLLKKNTNHDFFNLADIFVLLFISLRKLTSFDDWSSLCVHIAMDNALIVNDISKFITYLYLETEFFHTFLL